MSNYYEIFGISHDVSPEGIKKAYRKKARQLHPDVIGPGYEGGFREVSSTYEVLSDVDKHQMYDLSGGDAVRNGGGFGDGFARADFDDLSDIFQSFFDGGAANRGPTSRVRCGQDTLVAIDTEPSDAVFGITRSAPIDICVTCTACGDSYCAPGTEPVTCSQCNGVGNIQRMTHTLLGQMMTSSPCPGCQGYGTIIIIPCKDCSGGDCTRVRQDLEISIPAGVSTGARIRVSGCGEASSAGGPSGDFYLEIHEKPYEPLEHGGDDFYIELCTSMTAAALGAVFPLQILDDEQNVTVKAGSQLGDEVIPDDLGVGRPRRKGRRDLYVSIVAETPTRPGDHQYKLLAELAHLRGGDDVEPVYDSSVMSKLKERLFRC